MQSQSFKPVLKTAQSTRARRTNIQFGHDSLKAPKVRYMDKTLFVPQSTEKDLSPQVSLTLPVSQGTLTTRFKNLS